VTSSKECFDCPAADNEFADLQRQEHFVDTNACHKKFNSRPVTPTLLNKKKPFGERVEGLFLLRGVELHRRACNSKTRDFEDSTLGVSIGGKPLLRPKCLQSSKTFAAGSALSSRELTPTRKKATSALTLRVALSSPQSRTPNSGLDRISVLSP
jgi:hypothetical protein